LKKLFDSRAKALVRRAHADPVMLHLGSDATSFVIHSAARAKTEKNLIVHRRGRDMVELLIQRGWVETISGSGREHFVDCVFAKGIAEGTRAFSSFSRSSHRAALDAWSW